MGTVVSIANCKGGVGKTTTAINLAAFLALYGKKVLLYDLDPRGYAISGLGGYCDQFKHIQCMEPQSLRDGVMACSLKGLHVLWSPALTSRIQTGNEACFTDSLKRLKFTFDYVIMDVPPGTDVLQRAALMASASVLIPLQCSSFAPNSLNDTMDFLRQVARDHNPELLLQGIVLTMLCATQEHTREVASQIYQRFGDLLYHSFIPHDPILARASANGLSVAQFDLTSYGAFSYLELTREFLASTGQRLVEVDLGVDPRASSRLRRSPSSRRKRGGSSTRLRALNLKDPLPAIPTPVISQPPLKIEEPSALLGKDDLIDPPSADNEQKLTISLDDSGEMARPSLPPKSEE